MDIKSIIKEISCDIEHLSDEEAWLYAKEESIKFNKIKSTQKKCNNFSSRIYKKLKK